MEKDKIDRLILNAAGKFIQPSADFDVRFWRKVEERSKRPRIISIFEEIESILPMPSYAQAAAVLLVALLIGGTGGAVSAMNESRPLVAKTIVPGLQEISGNPLPTVSSVYLDMIQTSGEVK